MGFSITGTQRLPMGSRIQYGWNTHADLHKISQLVDRNSPSSVTKDILMVGEALNSPGHLAELLTVVCCCKLF